jgi:5-formyltetrahydrofolate cyclo-ligase
MNKNELRRHVRSLRAGLTQHERRRGAENLRKQVMRSGLLRRYRRIGFYIPMGEEIDLLPILNEALWLKRKCYLPVVPRRFQRQLWFSRLSNRNTWYRNRFGILEYWSPRQVRARRLDLIFVPLVAFDSRGYRLGMGGGFYDASLAYLARRRVWRKPLLVGVAYEFQKVEKIPHEPWDIPLDAVVTDRAVHKPINHE